MGSKLNLDYYQNKKVYSDGKIEDKILDIVKKHNDFTDILQKSNEWAIMYHLSPFRQNLLSWYDFTPDASLLEVGGGCGAFSGLFAEKLKNVKVVELSKRRAEIIYHRHKDFDNLEIFAGNLHDIKLNRKFDYITLIGVLEYAGKYTDSTNSGNSFKSFLEFIKSFLKDDGTILLAIENKFGLKYWAGAKEDHSARLFDSIEDYPNSKDVQTFGKPELEHLLKNAGFNKQFFYYPIPDYKLPRVIYSDDLLPDKSSVFDPLSPNYDQDRYFLFDENKAFKNIIKNDMFPFFANSFLIEAKR